MYPVDDGFILIATFNDREFGRLARLVGRPGWIEDPRFAKNAGRVANRQQLAAELTEALRGKTKTEWEQLLNAGTVSCGPINGMPDLERDPHAVERGVIVELEHPVNGTIRTAASPLRMSASPVSYRNAPPNAGEHTDKILEEWLAIGPEARAELRERNII